jgi:hypothetical protein
MNKKAQELAMHEKDTGIFRGSDSFANREN